MNGRTIVAFRATHNLSLKELEDLVDGVISHTAINAFESSNEITSKPFRYRFERLVVEFGIDNQFLGLRSYKKKGWKCKEKEVVDVAIQEIATTEVEERPASSHYHTGNIDVWAFADENFSLEEVTGFHRIDAIKYLTRYGKKDGYNRRDLEKAIVEIQKLLELHDKNRTEEA